MKLKSSLLYMILENPKTHNRYSKCFLNLKNVLMLEQEENFQFSEDILEKFDELEKKYNEFLRGIPLEVCELYLFDNIEDKNKYITILYQDLNTTIKVIELYIMLENFFKEVYSLTCLVANLYNLEVKINNSSNSNEEIF